ncbi:cation-dependent mannose-6-phosphate receptor-like isoform X1 [Acropora palmata]|uniref:cation-dependent mannose-6-phosphate receptor-like isoform X1 n=2 Tax=Acropora palmata TaxID=6131 RepID=UPI003DA199D0
MSLHPIDGGKSGPKFTAEQKGKTGKYKFSWNPCTPFSLPPQDGCKDVLLCQSNGDFRYPAGETVASFAETKGTDSITITYIPMKKEGDKSLRQGVIKLECDPSKYPGNFTSKFEEKDEKDNLIKYTATFASKCVCDNASSSGRKGPSTGSILLIVFIPLVFIYCITGTLYNKYNKGIGSFPEMIPNHSFWIGLPSLIKEGCAFTFHTLASCCSSLLMRLKGESYAEI